jgi:hypothetical protein
MSNCSYLRGGLRRLAASVVSHGSPDKEVSVEILELRHSQNTLDTVRAVEKLVAFYVQEHNSRLPHSVFREQTPDEMSFKTGASIPEEFEMARQEPA